MRMVESSAVIKLRGYWRQRARVLTSRCAPRGEDEQMGGSKGKIKGDNHGHGDSIKYQIKRESIFESHLTFLNNNYLKFIKILDIL